MSNTLNFSAGSAQYKDLRSLWFGEGLLETIQIVKEYSSRKGGQILEEWKI